MIILLNNAQIDLSSVELLLFPYSKNSKHVNCWIISSLPRCKTKVTRYAFFLLYTHTNWYMYRFADDVAVLVHIWKGGFFSNVSLQKFFIFYHFTVLLFLENRQSTLSGLAKPRFEKLWVQLESRNYLLIDLRFRISTLLAIRFYTLLVLRPIALSDEHLPEWEL